MDLQALSRLLLASLPFLDGVAELPPSHRIASQAVLPTAPADFQEHAAYLRAAEREVRERARPEQGGQRITQEWLQSLRSRDCQWRFRFTYDEILEMVDAFDIPEVFTTSGRYQFEGIEAFCLLCARFRSAGDMYGLSMQYDRSQSAISECINELVEFLDDRWEHLLGCDSEHLLKPSELARYAKAIEDRGAPTQSVFGFIDCTIRRICRPTWFQRQAYNGHKKYHALKFQAVMLPNGIIGHLYGPVEGRRNDAFMLTESQLLDRLGTFAFREGVQEDAPLEERVFQIFGDPAYGIGYHIMSPFAGFGERTVEEKEWNGRMAAVRIEVEHGFGIVANLWPFLNAGWKMQLYNSPVARYYRVGVLLTNGLNCLRPNQVSQYFDCMPPELNDYFHD
ncbi:hypothetical protein GLOTRDRAFT_93696 [Gloeophyllum trabeum ATCC 11539]|uniref:DDE Tnp4 domain-containing protein n=1 Tax=Gloeophyllum trabeum (strain ATCC 11539 / FP-39264 / Madison 617) TaxID=670483 RepID=S7RRD5_GLOTA|nr:uncharacterized protein GLOTRDRAFT_93696 [Gloeophyllum trabeum ATCC 11539]EPQ55484.1 hypothetical protein GLOTRDRAFT_93696 [Gloeophyllum trabeum ATCC 11539]